MSGTEQLNVVADFKDLYLTPGTYWITVSARLGKVGLDQVSRAISFEVSQSTFPGTAPHSGTWGHVHTVPNWNDLGTGKKRP